MNLEHSEFHDHLVRGLAHKMNNILTLFHGYLGLLLDDKTLEPAIMDGLAQIKEGAQTASDLMDRTGALVRPSSVIWREMDFGEFLREWRPSLTAVLQPGVELEIICPDHLPRLWVDASRLRKALIELLRNAGEASPPNGVVRIEAQDDESLSPNPAAHNATRAIRWVSINISDNGPGIPAEMEKKIFQPFFTTKHDEQTAGLGLSVALGLIQQLGGVLRLSSKPGKTSFRILLPSRSERF